MRYKESRYFKDWFRIGGNELKRAQNLLDLKDLGGAGFNIQQAIKKYLKGYMLSQGWELRRIHNLDTLLNEAIIYEPSLEEFRLPCQKITEYYVEAKISACSEFRADRRRNKGVSVHCGKDDRETQKSCRRVICV